MKDSQDTQLYKYVNETCLNSMNCRALIKEINTLKDEDDSSINHNRYNALDKVNKYLLWLYGKNTTQWKYNVRDKIIKAWPDNKDEINELFKADKKKTKVISSLSKPNLVSKENEVSITKGISILNTHESFKGSDFSEEYIFSKDRKQFIYSYNDRKIYAWYIPYLKEQLLYKHEDILSSFILFTEEDDEDIFKFLKTSLDAILDVQCNTIKFPLTMERIKPYIDDLTRIKKNLGGRLCDLVGVPSRKNRDLLSKEFFEGSFKRKIEFKCSPSDISQLN